MSEYINTLQSRKDEALSGVKSNPGASLKKILTDLPVRNKNVGPAPPKDDKAKKKAFEAECQRVRDVAAQCVLTVLCSIESSKIPNAVKELNEEERDTLMKFIYRGFGEREDVEEKGVTKKKATYDCNILLKAHEEVIKAAGGNGPIIRTIHTRLEV